jgi:hypothetical protein
MPRKGRPAARVYPPDDTPRASSRSACGAETVAVRSHIGDAGRSARADAA